MMQCAQKIALKSTAMTVFVLVAVVLGSQCVLAQQEWSYTQYQFNLFDANSAYAGDHQTLSASLRHRSQWIGMEGAPATDQLTLHTPLLRNHLGAGIRIVSDRIGARRQQSAKLSAAYKLKLHNARLSLAITGGMLRQYWDRNELQASDLNDAQLLQMNDAHLAPQLGAAVMYTSTRFFAGIGANSLNGVAMRSTSSSLARLYYNMNAVAGYIHPVSETDLLEISTQWKFSEGNIWQAEVNAQYLYRNKCWFGGGYRFESAWQVHGAWMVNELLRVGLSYDNTLGRVINRNQSSAELFLGYTLQKRAPGAVRYF